MKLDAVLQISSKHTLTLNVTAFPWRRHCISSIYGLQVVSGRSSAGAQQAARRQEVEAARRPQGFRVGEAVPASWDEDEEHKLAGERVPAPCVDNR